MTENTHYQRAHIAAAEQLLVPVLELESWAKYLNWGERLAGEGFISSPTVVQAFSEIPRSDFLTDEGLAYNGVDRPVQIGHKQTNSQPSLVGRMLELLQVRPGNRVLDVGAGSGWTTALMGHMVGSEGQVIGLERIPELVALGQANLAKYDYLPAEIRPAGEDLGLPEEAPFDRILVSARMPQSSSRLLRRQLSTKRGVMIAPVTSDVDHEQADPSTVIQRTKHWTRHYESRVVMRGVSFVPLIQDAGEQLEVKA